MRYQLNMKALGKICFWFSLIGMMAVPAMAAEFVPGINDLPLAPGLTAVADKTVEFNSPEGRIVDATASGAVSRSTIVEFYRRTLPQLGWKAESPVIFRRGRELLRLNISGDSASGTQVRFSLRPQPAR